MQCKAAGRAKGEMRAASGKEPGGWGEPPKQPGLSVYLMVSHATVSKASLARKFVNNKPTNLQGQKETLQQAGRPAQPATAVGIPPGVGHISPRG